MALRGARKGFPGRLWLRVCSKGLSQPWTAPSQLLRSLLRFFNGKISEKSSFSVFPLFRNIPVKFFFVSSHLRASLTFCNRMSVAQQVRVFGVREDEASAAPYSDGASVVLFLCRSLSIKGQSKVSCPRDMLLSKGENLVRES